MFSLFCFYFIYCIVSSKSSPYFAIIIGGLYGIVYNIEPHHNFSFLFRFVFCTVTALESEMQSPTQRNQPLNYAWPSDVQTSSIRCTKSKNLNVSGLVFLPVVFAQSIEARC